LVTFFRLPNVTIYRWSHPPPSCRGRRTARVTSAGVVIISIHALVQRAAGVFASPQCEAIISIHALVQRAAEITLLNYGGTTISIHALVQRAARCSARRRMAIWHFNPRPRAEGGRVQLEGWSPLQISIHALVQRAARIRQQETRRAIFQSTPSCRGRPIACGLW